MAILTPNQIGAALYECAASMPSLTGRVYESGKTDPLSGKQRAAAVAWLDTAIAICLAESGGNTNAKNPNSSAAGLWQIMQSVHGDKIKAAITHQSNEAGKSLTIFDPLVNTEVADKIYQAASGWTPWEVYNTGAYKKRLGHGESVYKYLTSKAFQGQAREALEANAELGYATAATAGALVPGGALINRISDMANGEIMQAILKFAKDSGMTIGMFLAGLVLIILGLWFIIGQSKLAGVAKKTPIGKVLT